jgi:hypothetical protein
MEYVLIWRSHTRGGVIGTRTPLLFFMIFLMTFSGPMVEPPVEFLLQSTTVSASGADVKSTTSSTPTVAVLSTSSSTPKDDEHKNTVSARSDRRNKKRKVVFSDHLESLNKVLRGTTVSADFELVAPAFTGPTLNLGAMKDTCEYLCKNCGCFPTSETSSAYIAFLRRPSFSRYVFYVCRRKRAQSNRPPMLLHRSISLCDYLRSKQKGNITPVHQFKIALKLARAMLQYCSTPWLGNEWGISQVQLIPSSEKELDYFQLYLNSRIPGPFSPNASSKNLGEDTPMIPPSLFSNAIQRGINNITLFCLGMALLEIGNWQPASDLRDDTFDEDIIDAVRRLANDSSRLGKRYDAIIQKCIRCNFLFGTDLSQVELQRAVYSEVVFPLEELIEKLDGLHI